MVVGHYWNDLSSHFSIYLKTERVCCQSEENDEKLRHTCKRTKHTLEKQCYPKQQLYFKRQRIFGGATDDLTVLITVTILYP